MAKNNRKGLDFIVDDLTESIEKVNNGERFETDVKYASLLDVRSTTKKSGWLFDWKKEFFHTDRFVYKLITVKQPEIIQGLISLQIRADHIEMHLLESAPFNIGKSKEYNGVAGNLVAFACQLSFNHGFEGNIAFTSKTKLISHYEKTLGAHRIGGQKMVIEKIAASKLVNKYFKI